MHVKLGSSQKFEKMNDENVISCTLKIAANEIVFS